MLSPWQSRDSYFGSDSCDSRNSRRSSSAWLCLDFHPANDQNRRIWNSCLVKFCMVLWRHPDLQRCDPDRRPSGRRPGSFLPKKRQPRSENRLAPAHPEGMKRLMARAGSRRQAAPVVPGFDPPPSLGRLSGLRQSRSISAHGISPSVAVHCSSTGCASAASITASQDPRRVRYSGFAGCPSSNQGLTGLCSSGNTQPAPLVYIGTCSMPFGVLEEPGCPSSRSTA